MKLQWPKGAKAPKSVADVIVVPSIFYIRHAWCMEGRVGGFSRSPKNIVAQIQPCYKHCKPECDKLWIIFLPITPSWKSFLHLVFLGIIPSVMALMQLNSVSLFVKSHFNVIFSWWNGRGFKRERSSSENEVDSIPPEQHTDWLNLNQQESHGEQLLSNPVSAVQ